MTSSNGKKIAGYRIFLKRGVGKWDQHPPFQILFLFPLTNDQREHTNLICPAHQC